ncbi:hypothetical protein ACTGJ9_036960 [Bradyrhizobium sp. RDM12]
MQYTDGSFADVKSISQQAMCRYWARTAGDLPFPSLDQFRPEARLHDPKQLVIWSVERRPDGHTFRALYQGASVGEVFNSSWAGKSMDEVLPPALKEFGLAAAEQCVSSGCAIYSVFSTHNSGGHTIDCERLLLPLGRAGRVEQLVGSLQLISRIVQPRDRHPVFRMEDGRILRIPHLRFSRPPRSRRMKAGSGSISLTLRT